MAKFLMLPGTYNSGDSIPLMDTALRCGSIYHEGGSPIVQLKGSGCIHRPNQYTIGIGATLASVVTTPEQLALLQDGVRVGGGLLSIDAAAANETNTVSIPNEIGAVGSVKLAVEAVTAVTIVDGVVVIHRTV